MSEPDKKVLCDHNENGNSLKRERKPDSKGPPSKRSRYDFDVSKYGHKSPMLFLAKATIMHELPFSMVDFPYFKSFIRSLQLSIDLPAPMSIESACMKVYKMEKEKIKDLVNSLECRITLACDVWTSQQNLVSIVLTAHFIDSKWKLQKRTLSVSEVDFYKIGDRPVVEYVYDTILKKLVAWNAHKKLFCIVLGDACLDDRMVRKLKVSCGNDDLTAIEGLFHVNCLPQTLNAMVQEALKLVNPEVVQIRQSIEHIHCLVENRQKFCTCIKQLLLPEISLDIDAPTSWDSTYKMLGNVLKLKKAFASYANIVDESSCFLSELKWGNIETVYECLVPVYKLAKSLSTAKDSFSSFHFLMICELKLILVRWCKEENASKYSIACKMSEKLDRYWNQNSNVLAIASVLDPRMKMEAVEYYFPKIYGDDVGKEKISEFTIFLFDLYRKYQEGKPPVRVSHESVDDKYSNTTIHLNTAVKGLNDFIAENLSKATIKNAFELYLEDPRVAIKDSVADDFDILTWWKTNNLSYPLLGNFVREFLAIPVRILDPDKVFTSGNRVLEKFSSCCDAKTAQKLICAQNWLLCEFEEAKEYEAALMSFCKSGGELYFREGCVDEKTDLSAID